METHVLRQEQNHMATIFDFRISCPKADLGRADRLLLDAHRAVTKLEEELTEFMATSPVYRLNQAGVGRKVFFPKHAFALLLRSNELSLLTEGAFNPLAKSTENSALAWDEGTQEVWKTGDGAHLSFGAIGKGYALDVVRSMLVREGFENFLLSAGGSSVILSGLQAPSVPWSWGWSWKKDETGRNLGIALRHSSGKPIAIGVSGTHEKGNHIVGSSQGSLKSALIAHCSAADADALSTGLFVLGWESARRVLSDSTLPIAMAAIDQAEVPRWNGVFQSLWKGLAASTIALAAFCALPTARAADSVDLSALDAGTNTFTPYILERNSAWVLLPLFALFMVLIHLKKVKTQKRRTSMSIQPEPPKKSIRPLMTLALASAAWLSMEHAQALEIEPLGKAVMAVLGTSKAQKKVIDNTTVFYAKDASGKISKAAFIQTGVYEPNCGHKWVVGIDGATGDVTEVRPVEMACPHAFPTRSASFLDQYKGKGPADADKLDSEVTTVAKATGTSRLTTDAVKKSIVTFQKFRGQL